MMRPSVLLFSGFLAAAMVSCATKKDPASPKPATSGPSASPSPSPSPSPQPSPQPSPAPSATPIARYTATVRVEGGEPTRQDVTPPADPTPAPTPAVVPSATPSPTPKPKNFLVGTWHKIFPPKPPRNPPSAPATPVPKPPPAPRPEGFFSRMWHKVFPPKKAPPLARPPQWIGTIKLVNEREGYVLVDAPNSSSLAPGETLNSVGRDAESGVLRTTADRNAPFFIADIVSGKPQSGDRIYSPQP